MIHDKAWLLKSLGMHTDSVVIRIHAQPILPHMNMFFGSAHSKESFFNQKFNR